MKHQILPKLWNIDYLQNGLKSTHFKVSLFLEFWEVRILRTSNLCLLLFDVLDVQKKLKKAKFEVDKIRRSTTNGKYELVVYQRASRIC